VHQPSWRAISDRLPDERDRCGFVCVAIRPSRSARTFQILLYSVGHCKSLLIRDSRHADDTHVGIDDWFGPRIRLNSPCFCASGFRSGRKNSSICFGVTDRPVLRLEFQSDVRCCIAFPRWSKHWRSWSTSRWTSANGSGGWLSIPMTSPSSLSALASSR